MSKKNKTHGMSRTPTYRSWESMKRRCKYHKRYLRDKIFYCESWEYFENFLMDMGLRPENKTLDRFPVTTKQYNKSNCRWATKREQCINRTAAKTKQSSKFKGVSFKKNTTNKIWTATCNKIHIGCFSSEEKAALAYDVRAVFLWRENAITNF